MSLNQLVVLYTRVKGTQDTMWYNLIWFDKPNKIKLYETRTCTSKYISSNTIQAYNWTNKI